MGPLRSIILSLASVAGLVPAISFAAAPPPVPALPDTERRTSYSITGTTCACAVNFAIYGDATDVDNWIEVFVNGVPKLSTDGTFGWAITSPTGPLATIPRPITDAVLTFNAVQTATVQIVGARRPRRVSQFSENRGVAARDLNQAITDLVAQLRENWDKTNDLTGRAVLARPGETLNLLPILANRQNLGACFDSGGNLTSCISVPSSTLVAGNGILLTGVSPTTIANNIAAGSGISITGTNPLTIATQAKLITPQDFGAVCDGATNDAVALQNWANALRDGGNGASPSVLGCATATTITFQPSTNTAPVQGPHIFGNLKLIGHASLPVNNDLLRVWNPTAVSTTQNFYYAQFDSLELSTTTGTGNCLSVRGFWGRIGQVFGRSCGGDVLQFPNFTFGGVPDEYESNPTIGDVTSIGAGGWVVNNLIGIGATPRFSNIRGTVVSSITTGAGSANLSGSEQINGGISYTGTGWGVIVSAQGVGARAHEVFTQGQGDIDCAQNGVKIQEADTFVYTGHRLNVEAANFCGGGVPQWPLTAFSIGKVGGGGGVVNGTINAYMTFRPGVTAVGSTFFDFNNEVGISNLTVNVYIIDSAGILAGMTFAQLYKNINANATLKIVQNGVVVYDNTNQFTVAQLPPCVFGLRGVRKYVSDSTTATFGAAVTGGGGLTTGVICLAGGWTVG